MIWFFVFPHFGHFFHASSVILFIFPILSQNLYFGHSHGSYSFAIVYDNRILHAAVTDYTADIYEGHVIWEKDFNMEADGFDGGQVWDEMYDALTAGL